MGWGSPVIKNARLPEPGSAVRRSQADDTARTGHADIQANIPLPHGTDGVRATRSPHEGNLVSIGVGPARLARPQACGTLDVSAEEDVISSQRF